jgi:hypothetical protein
MGTLGFILLYLDPGTGSLIIQLVIAAVTGAVFFIKSIREMILSYFKNLRYKFSKKK